MPAKAGKFSLIPGNISVLGRNGFKVDGVGFNPDIVILMSVGLGVENAWNTAPNIWGGMSIWSNNTVGAPQANTGVNEFWGTDVRPSSFWSNSGVIWFKNEHSGGGSAIFIGGTHDDGFYIGYPDGGYEGHYGTICYYLCLSGDGEVGQIYAYHGAPNPVTVGFEPSIYMSLGSGGLSGGAGDIGFVDFSTPSWGFGGYQNVGNPGGGSPEWMANGLARTETVEQVRFFDDGEGDQWIFDGYTAGQIIGNSAYSFGRSETQVSYGITDGFPSGDSTRTSLHFMSEALYTGAGITPNPVGIPLEVDVGFSPDCVIFLGPQTNHGNLFGVPWGGRCFGFLTEDFQCCIAWGAYQRGSDGDPPGVVASFCSSDVGWVSNFTSDALDDPGNPNYGVADLLPSGFEITTSAMPKANAPMRYVAYGFDEGKSQFFEVLD